MFNRFGNVGCRYLEISVASQPPKPRHMETLYLKPLTSPPVPLLPISATPLFQVLTRSVQYNLPQGLLQCDSLNSSEIRLPITSRNTTYFLGYEHLMQSFVIYPHGFLKVKLRHSKRLQGMEDQIVGEWRCFPTFFKSLRAFYL